MVGMPGLPQLNFKFVICPLDFNPFLPTPIGHQSDVISSFNVSPKFKFAVAKCVLPSRKWLWNYSFVFGIFLCYLTSWWIIRCKWSALIGSGIFGTWHCAPTRHVTKTAVNRVIWQHRLQIFGMIAAVTTLYTMFDHRISALTATAPLNGTEWHCHRGYLPTDQNKTILAGVLNYGSDSYRYGLHFVYSGFF